MTKVPPPVLGFNNNVRHRGRVFHIQTEDSGVRNPRLVTHLFADGGRIIKTIRTDYTQHLNRDDLAAAVRQMMKAQHKAMFLALRAGEIDEVLEAACGPLPLPPARQSGTLSVAPNPEGAESTPVSVVPVATGGAAADVRASAAPRAAAAPVHEAAEETEEPTQPLELVIAPPDSSPDGAHGGVSLLGLAGESLRPRGTPGALKPRIATRSDRPTHSRPAARYSAPSTSSQSIFGDAAISEKSLDEVILSYIADDLEHSD